jgi:hypothetical protein
MDFSNEADCGMERSDWLNIKSYAEMAYHGIFPRQIGSEIEG